MPDEQPRQRNEAWKTVHRLDGTVYDDPDAWEARINREANLTAVRRLLGWDRAPFVPIHFDPQEGTVTVDDTPFAPPRPRGFARKDAPPMPDAPPVHDPHLSLWEFCSLMEGDTRPNEQALTGNTEFIAIFHARMTRFRVLAAPLSRWQQLWSDFVTQEGAAR